MLDFIQDVGASIKNSSKEGFTRLENWAPGGRLTLGTVFIAVLVVVVGLTIGWAILPALLVSATITGLFWPGLVLSTLVRDPPRWARFTLTSICFAVLSFMMQHLQIFMSVFVLLLALGIAAGFATWRWVSPAVGRWILWKGLTTFVALIYVIPGLLCILYGPQEFRVRAVMRDENLGVYMVHTDLGAEGNQVGESLRNEDMPLWNKYGSDDLQGLLSEAKEKNYTVRAWVTYVRWRPLHLHRNIVKVTEIREDPPN